VSGQTFGSRAEFTRASRSALRLLHDQLGHDLWMVTRLDGDHLHVVDCVDDGYGIQRGDVIPWATTIDSRMVAGAGPNIAPSVAEVPAYATAPVALNLPVGSYAGVPLVHGGALFGTLSGLHPVALPDAVRHSLPIIEALADMLATVVALEVTAHQVTRRAERAEVEAHVDPLTQLGNRLAWTKVLAEEEERCRRYGRPACVISVDLDGLKRANDEHGHAAGDRLLHTAALVLRKVSRMCDHVARVGGDEFAVLAVEASELDGRALLERISTAFRRSGIDASIGIAVREAHASLDETWRAADLAMYRHKRRLKVAAALAGVDVTGSPQEHAVLG
jgi:diguanylate cyclase (GGDEF)-like protein